MKLVRKHMASRFFFLVMALNIFNYSVDNPDLHSDFIAEDLNFNDMESIIEIVLEQGLDIENAFPEHDEQDNEETNAGLKKRIDFLNCKIEKEIVLPIFNSSQNNLQVYKNQYSNQFHPEIVPPPPKA